MAIYSGQTRLRIHVKRAGGVQRKAYPSTFVLYVEGTLMGETTSSAMTWPRSLGVTCLCDISVPLHALYAKPGSYGFLQD